MKKKSRSVPASRRERRTGSTARREYPLNDLNEAENCVFSNELNQIILDCAVYYLTGIQIRCSVWSQIGLLFNSFLIQWYHSECILVIGDHPTDDYWKRSLTPFSQTLSLAACVSMAPPTHQIRTCPLPTIRKSRKTMNWHRAMHWCNRENSPLSAH